ncbi:MAG: hypothetical protein AB1791_10165 [Chloroflexota bacterium]
MLTRLSDKLFQLARGRVILVFLVLEVLFNVIFQVIGTRIRAASGGVGAIDLLFTYTPEQVFGMVAAYGEAGRRLYAWVEVTADLVYPIVYSLFFSLLITYLFRRASISEKLTRWAGFVPLTGALFDYAENIGIVTMLLSFPAQPAAVALLSSIFTTIKWLLAGASLVLVLAGLVLLLISRLRR